MLLLASLHGCEDRKGPLLRTEPGEVREIEGLFRWDSTEHDGAFVCTKEESEALLRALSQLGRESKSADAFLASITIRYADGESSRVRLGYNTVELSGRQYRHTGAVWAVVLRIQERIGGPPPPPSRPPRSPESG